MKKTFEELSGGATLNSEEMFALKGGVSAKSYGCKSLLCTTAGYICEAKRDAELGEDCSTAVCESGAYPCKTNTYTIIKPPTICNSKISDPTIKPVG